MSAPEDGMVPNCTDATAQLQKAFARYKDSLEKDSLKNERDKREAEYRMAVEIWCLAHVPCIRELASRWKFRRIGEQLEPSSGSPIAFEPGDEQADPAWLCILVNEAVKHLLSKLTDNPPPTPYDPERGEFHPWAYFVVVNFWNDLIGGVNGDNGNLAPQTDDDDGDDDEYNAAYGVETGLTPLEIEQLIEAVSDERYDDLDLDDIMAVGPWLTLDQLAQLVEAARNGAFGDLTTVQRRWLTRCYNNLLRARELF